jgi:hypothetical protein
MLESAGGLLHHAGTEERRAVIARAAALAARTSDAEKKAFLENIGRNLGLTE